MNRHKVASGLIVFLLILTIGSTILRPIMAETAQKEAALNPEGQVHELFRDDQGQLWVSDFFADEIWRVDPASGAYTVYGNLVGASDGRLDSQGQLWWSDFDGSAVGRLVPGASKADLWPLPAGGNPLGLAFGTSGQVWIADATEPVLYRFASASAQLCTYALPGNGSADYILYHADRVWLGDAKLGRILRLNPNNGAVAIWQLPSGAYPQGMVFDGGGSLWWADPGLGALAKFEPGSGRLTTFIIPPANGTAAKPEAVAVREEALWYSDHNGRIGLLDPLLSSGESVFLSPTTRTVAAGCSAAGGGIPINVSERSGTLNWNSVDYNLVVNNGGWLIYELPSGAAPWGLAASGNNVWFADQGTAVERSQQLGWIHFTGTPPPTVTPSPSPNPEPAILLPVVISG